MKKLVLLLFLILAVMQTATAQTLEGKITYTVDSARKITFDGVKKQIPVSLFSSYLIDPDYKSSMDYIKYELSPTDRDIEVFKKGKFKIGYAVTYNNNKDITYYFTKFKGLLIAIDIYESTKNQKTKYPRKCYRYDTNGQLIAAGIRVSEEESFLYDKKQKLITHRIGDYGYNDKGKRMWKAEEIEF